MAALVQKSKIDENNQCQWAVEEEVVFILHRDMAWFVFSFRNDDFQAEWIKEIYTQTYPGQPAKQHKQNRNWEIGAKSRYSVWRLPTMKRLFVVKLYRNRSQDTDVVAVLRK